MPKIHISGLRISIGFTIGLAIVALPVLLLGITDIAIYIWAPGTSLVTMLGGGGLHDRNGILYLIAGILIDLLLYSSVATLALEFLYKGNRVASR